MEGGRNSSGKKGNACILGWVEVVSCVLFLIPRVFMRRLSAAGLEGAFLMIFRGCGMGWGGMCDVPRELLGQVLVLGGGLRKIDTICIRMRVPRTEPR